MPILTRTLYVLDEMVIRTSDAYSTMKSFVLDKTAHTIRNKRSPIAIALYCLEIKLHLLCLGVCVCVCVCID
jgi:hypothetical protein